MCICLDQGQFRGQFEVLRNLREVAGQLGRPFGGLVRGDRPQILLLALRHLVEEVSEGLRDVCKVLRLEVHLIGSGFVYDDLSLLGMFISPSDGESQTYRAIGSHSISKVIDRPDPRTGPNIQPVQNDRFGLCHDLFEAL